MDQQSTQSSQNKQPKELQLELLVTQHLVLGKPLAQCARDMNVSSNVIYRLASSDEFLKRKELLKERFGRINENFLQSAESDLKGLWPKAYQRIEEIITSSLDEKVVARVADSIMDRVGLGRQQKVEAHHVLELSKESIQLLTQSLAEHEAIEIPSTDWSFAHERPTDTRTRLLSQRPTQAEASRESPEVDLLHGEGDNRLQRLGPRYSRDDGSVDSKRQQEAVGFSPARSLEDIGVDDS